MKNDMPPTVREISHLVGDAAAMRVVTRYGGRQIRFHGTIRHDLAAIIGLDATRLLAGYFGVMEVYIPRCLAEVRKARNAALRERFDHLTKTTSARAAVATLAEEFYLSDRTVWKLLKG